MALANCNAVMDRKPIPQVGTRWRLQTPADCAVVRFVSLNHAEWNRETGLWFEDNGSAAEAVGLVNRDWVHRFDASGGIPMAASGVDPGG